MLSNAAFQQHMLHLGLSAEARHLVATIRTSPPSRNVTGRAGNVCVRYPSRKMGHTIQAESHHVELAAIYGMEHDPAVLEYYDQPPPLTLTYLSPQGRTVTVRHTPDFFVIRTDGLVWEEWKQAEAMRRVPPGSRCACSPGSGKQPGRDINADKQLIHQHRDTWSRHMIPFRLHAAHGWWERIFHTRSVPPGECQSHHHPGTDACIIRGEAHHIWQSRRPLAGGIFRWSD